MRKLCILLILLLLLTFISASCASSISDFSHEPVGTAASNTTKVEKPDECYISNGWSIKDDELSAINEAAYMMESVVRNPVLIFLYLNPDYDVRKVVEQLNSRYKNAKVFGTTSKNEVITNEGIHKGNKGSLAILGIESNELIAGVSAQNFGDAPDARIVKEMTQKAVENAVDDSGMSKTEMPEFIYMSCFPGFEEEVLEQIQSNFGKDIKIYGGDSTANVKPGSPDSNVRAVIGNDRIYTRGVTIAIIYSGIKIGSSFKAGFFDLNNEKSGTVTAIEEPNCIKTIDGKPALDVYNEWTAGFFNSQIAGGTVFTNRTDTYHLLAITLNFENKNEMILAAVVKMDPKNKYIYTASKIANQEKIYYVLADKEVLINRTPLLVTDALVEGMIKKSEIKGGLFDICSGARNYIGDNISDVVSSLNTEMEGNPWIGFISQGEQGHIKGYGNFHGNYMTSIVIFGQ